MPAGRPLRTRLARVARAQPRSGSWSIRIAPILGFVLYCVVSAHPVAAKTGAKNRELSQNNQFALNVKSGVAKLELKLKGLELMGREPVSDDMTRTSWRVEISGPPEQALKMLEDLRRSSRRCAMASLRMQRAAISLGDFEVSSSWQCYE